MSHDPLAPFRRPGAAPAASPEAQDAPTAGQGGYRAYSVASGPTKPQRLELRAKDGLAAARPYGSLLEIIYDRVEWSGIVLVFPGKTIKLNGRELRPIVEALIAGSCEYIAQLGDGETAPKGEPVILSIATASAGAPAKPPAKPAEG